MQCYPESLAGPPLHDLGDPALRAEVHQRDERGERGFRGQLEEGEERAFPEGRRVRVLRVFETEVQLEPIGRIVPFRLVFDDEREQDFGRQLRLRAYQKTDGVLFEAGGPKIHVDLATGPQRPGRQALAERPDGAQHLLPFFPSLVLSIGLQALDVGLRLL
ncbi:hypothetical protein D3C71_1350090 [compost metagenome]